MKTKEYYTENFETEFEQATTITALQQLLKRMKIQRVKWIAGGLHHSPPHPVLLLDEQTGLVEWELQKLKDAQSRGRFRAYYAFLKMLDEHYPYKTPLIRYKYILDDGVNELKQEILSNMLHLIGDQRGAYLERIQYKMEELLRNVYAPENTVDEWCQKFDTTERDIFSTKASKHRNGVYKLLSAAAVAAGDSEIEDEDAYEIQNDFYNVYYGRAVREVLNLVNAQILKYGEKNLSRKDAETQREEEIKELEDLFYNKSQAERCINMLRETEYPLIGEQDNYIGKLKGALCVWITELDRQSVIKHRPDNLYANLLRNKFSGLAPFNSSLFRKPNNKAEERYRAVFRKRIEAIGRRN